MATLLQLLSQFEGKTTRQKTAIKAAVLAEFSIPRTARATLDIEVDSMGVFDGGVYVLARAWRKDGTQIGFSDGTVDLERFRIFLDDDSSARNLSWLVVPDPNGLIPVERTQTNLDGTVEIVTDRYRFDPKEHLLMFLERVIDSLETYGPENIVQGKVGNTVSAFTANSSGDGQVRRGPNTNSTWTLARDTAAGESAVTNETEALFFCGDYENPNNYTVARLFFPFDTSSIPDTDTISSATLLVRQVAVAGSGSGDRAVGLIQTSQASSTALATGDFDALTVDAPAEGATRITMNTADTDWTFTLNATGRGWISQTGNTLLGLRGGYDIDNTTPAARNYSSIAFADHATAAYRPTLTVTHSAAASTFTPRVSFIM